MSDVEQIHSLLLQQKEAQLPGSHEGLSMGEPPLPGARASDVDRGDSVRKSQLLVVGLRKIGAGMWHPVLHSWWHGSNMIHPLPQVIHFRASLA